HDWLLSIVNHHANITVTYVSEHVLPMSPVYTKGDKGGLKTKMEGSSLPVHIFLQNEVNFS
ncbi:MAG: hypothetical protein AMJ73_04245, partial [candidate division Zixibacteria bacterium SM1_73]